MRKIGDINYQRNVELGILVALLSLIIFFFISQRNVQMGEQNLEVQPQFSIEMIEVPITVQERKNRKIKPRLPFIPVPAEETEILKEVTIIHGQVRLSDSFGIADAKRPPLMARQLFEAIPQEPDLPIQGQITLALKIGIQGKVIEYRLIENTTKSELYLKSVLNAIKESRWQPARINGIHVDSWIQKTYRIDTRSSE